jgi:hypothetical protein
VTGTNATAVDGAPVAAAVLAALAVVPVPAVAPVLAADVLAVAGVPGVVLEPPQPASRPIAATAASVSPPRAWLMTLPPAQAPHA